MLSVEQTKQLESFLDSLAKTSPIPDAGSICLIGDDISEDDPLYGCTVVFCDYDVTGHEREEEFAEWYYDVVPGALAQYMASLNLEEVYDNDGSGGGLYYGATYYREVG